jgi:lysophospholipase L1-like esterase
MTRRWPAAVLAVLAAVSLACEGRAGGGPDKPPPRPVDLPSSMAALGDSITAGYGGCLTLVTCRRVSWSTGDGSRVDSHYRRILDGNRAIRGRTHNFATPGARAGALPEQARAAVRARVEYVTILIGANDACRRDVGAMTDPDTFREQVDSGLRVLRQGLPEARVLVASLPDLYRLWEVGRTDRRAVRAWSRGICPSLLADATSEADGDARRRAAVRERVEAYNRELREACRAYGDRCRYDGGAVHRVRFTLDMVSPLDFFHPDVEGQDKLAEVTWPRRFRW